MDMGTEKSTKRRPNMELSPPSPDLHGNQFLLNFKTVMILTVLKVQRPHSTKVILQPMLLHRFQHINPTLQPGTHTNTMLYKVFFFLHPHWSSWHLKHASSCIKAHLYSSYGFLPCKCKLLLQTFSSISVALISLIMGYAIPFQQLT